MQDLWILFTFGGVGLLGSVTLADASHVLLEIGLAVGSVLLVCSTELTRYGVRFLMRMAKFAVGCFQRLIPTA